jgi:hypothetical protein
MCVVILTKPVPAMNQWGMIAFVVLAGVGSLIYLIRRKRA